ncbi:MAG: hypothetical protein M1827_001025 [Pycnora praestabilis]|nr:MAG: hypothetical protein M1827_001025 [Pycnora praestabilis]
MATENINLVPSTGGEIIKIGPVTLRVMEDGSHTDNRIGTVEITLPPHTAGPPQHWHQMHDETFLITKGVVRFTTRDKHHDSHEGDYVVVPPKAPHTFENASDAEARFLNTFTPAFYVDYFRLMAKEAEKGKPVSREATARAMAQFATMPVGGPPTKE